MIQSVVSSGCNQLMVNMGSVCGRYYKPVVVVCCTSVQCSVGLGGPDELVIATSYTNISAVHCYQRVTPRHWLIEQELLQDKQVKFVFSDSSVSDNIGGGVMSYKDECGQGDCLVVDEMVQASKDDDFVVNCIAVQETCS